MATPTTPTTPALTESHPFAKLSPLLQPDTNEGEPAMDEDTKRIRKALVVTRFHLDAFDCATGPLQHPTLRPVQPTSASRETPPTPLASVVTLADRRREVDGIRRTPKGG